MSVTNSKLAAQALAPTQPKAAATREAPEDRDNPMSVGFEDLLDAVNPLQQLPIVSSLYREATGETISIPARLAGGFLYGGPIGLLGGAASALFEGITGDDVLGHLETMVNGSGGETAEPNGTAVAAAAQPWLKRDGQDGGAPSPAPSPATAPSAPASAEALAEALNRKTAAAAVDDAAPLRPEERPAPEVLAKLYALHTTDDNGAKTVRF